MLNQPARKKKKKKETLELFNRDYKSLKIPQNGKPRPNRG